MDLILLGILCCLVAPSIGQGPAVPTTTTTTTTTTTLNTTTTSTSNTTTPPISTTTKTCQSNADCNRKIPEVCIDSQCESCRDEAYSDSDECKELIEPLVVLVQVMLAVGLIVLLAGIVLCCCFCVCCPGYQWRNQRKMNRAEARKYQAEDNGGSRSTFATPRPTPGGGTFTTRPVKDEPPPVFEFPTEDVETREAKP